MRKYSFYPFSDSCSLTPLPVIAESGPDAGMKQSKAEFTSVICSAQPLLLNLLDKALARDELAHDPRKLSTVLEAMKVY